MTHTEWKRSVTPCFYCRPRCIMGFPMHTPSLNRIFRFLKFGTGWFIQLWPVKSNQHTWVLRRASNALQFGEITHLFRPRVFFVCRTHKCASLAKYENFPPARDVALAHSGIVFEMFFLLKVSLHVRDRHFCRLPYAFRDKNWFTSLPTFTMLANHVEKYSMAKVHDSRMAPIPSELVGFHWPQPGSRKIPGDDTTITSVRRCWTRVNSAAKRRLAGAASGPWTISWHLTGFETSHFPLELTETDLEFRIGGGSPCWASSGGRLWCWAGECLRRSSRELGTRRWCWDVLQQVFLSAKS